MTIRVGEVVAVRGVQITLRVDDNSNHETFHYNGEKYRGISIREYIGIQRGFRTIICIIEGEYLDESRADSTSGRTNYIRKVDARPIGYLSSLGFHDGVKYLPMIKDSVYLLPEEVISKIFGDSAESKFAIGRMLKEDLIVSLPWQRLFNTHIGIFGNTGSGKSNTLARLFTTLFETKIDKIKSKSKFCLIDFNGEYTSNQLAKAEDKIILKLSSREDGGDKFAIAADEFWNADILGLLFQATINTQRPFLNRMIEGRNRNKHRNESLSGYCRFVFKNALGSASPRSESLEILKHIARIIQDGPLADILNRISWSITNSNFYMPGRPHAFMNNENHYQQAIGNFLDQVALGGLDVFDEMQVRAHLLLANDITNQYVQFEHIQPLLKRMEATVTALKRVLIVQQELPVEEKVLKIISLKRCDSFVKKVMPLLIGRHLYSSHKDAVANPPDRTMHLIIDEAHNILSQQSARESESWKDYRLELFEEIIKEGRKFGMFITLCSQRPADISPTIISQLHNFFIHRLVNDKDLYLIDNAITTLDSMSKALIPTLSKGCCIATGTAFDIPMVLQVDPLDKKRQPDSEDVDLSKLWV